MSYFAGVGLEKTESAYKHTQLFELHSKEELAVGEESTSYSTLKKENRSVIKEAADLPERLIKKDFIVDAVNDEDRILNKMIIAENNLLKVGAIPGKDYNYLDLLAFSKDS